MPAFALKAERDQLVIDQLIASFGEEVLAHERLHDMLCITVKKGHILDILRHLKEQLDFNFLTTLCGMHHPGTELEIGLVYHLHSFRNGHRIRIKTFTKLSDPVFPTATVLWEAANWMERETWDFFGVQFTGHPNLKRILNMEDFPAFPMRKDYPLEDAMREDKDDSMFGR